MAHSWRQCRAVVEATFLPQEQNAQNAMCQMSFEWTNVLGQFNRLPGALEGISLAGWSKRVLATSIARWPQMGPAGYGHRYIPSTLFLQPEGLFSCQFFSTDASHKIFLKNYLNNFFQFQVFIIFLLMSKITQRAQLPPLLCVCSLLCNNINKLLGIIGSIYV